MSVFESLSDKLQATLAKIKGSGRVTEKDVKDMMRDIKMALLEADVNFKVVKDFVAKVSDRCVGVDVLESLTPGQQIIKIVNEELVELLGSTNSKIVFAPRPPTIIMLVGLQGAGKTTHCGKLANQLRKQGKKPLMVACDIYRPAAVKQLQVIGDQLKIPVFHKEGEKPVAIAKAAVDHAERMLHDLIIIDTAGRLHIDEPLMQELADLKTSVKPHEILLVVDSMTGQDAVTVAQSFNERLGVDGLILTKMDGDTRGGAALSVKAVTGKPIKFVGMGEKLNELEPFYPDRMASRILGMGDVLSLIEKAQENFDEKQAADLERKMRTQQFTFEDFLDQLRQIKKLGPLQNILGMLPGMNAKALSEINVDEKQFTRIEAIIQSMTRKERLNPDIINGQRRKRIAAGSGTTVQEINKLLRDFEEMKKMMKMFTSQKGKFNKKAFGNMKLPF